LKGHRRLLRLAAAEAIWAYVTWTHYSVIASSELSRHRPVDVRGCLQTAVNGSLAADLSQVGPKAPQSAPDVPAPSLLWTDWANRGQTLIESSSLRPAVPNSCVAMAQAGTVQNECGWRKVCPPERRRIHESGYYPVTDTSRTDLELFAGLHGLPSEVHRGPLTSPAELGWTGAPPEAYRRPAP
jgi:hypothetical protein